MRIHLEKLSRLNVASIIVVSPDLPKQSFIQMKGSTLKLNDKEVYIHGLEFQENSLTVERNDKDESIWFRTPLASSSGLQTRDGESVDIVQNKDSRLDLVMNRSILNQPKPRVDIGKCYKISCNKCETQLARLEVERVLPLPSSDWNQLASNWFCCSTRKHVQKGLNTAKLNARKGDLIYGIANFLISKDIILENAVIMYSDKNLARCSSCSAELGLFSDESIFLWYYSVQISSLPVPGHISSTPGHISNSTLPRIITSSPVPEHIYLNSMITSARENFIVILESKLADTNEKMPRIKLKTHVRKSSEYLKVWILDKDLSCYTCDDIYTAKPTQQRMIKLAFKQHVDNSNASQGCHSQSSVNEYLNVATMPESDMEIELSDVMYDEAFLMFLESCLGFPDSCVVLADMQVAYVPLRG